MPFEYFNPYHQPETSSPCATPNSSNERPLGQMVQLVMPCSGFALKEKKPMVF